MLRDKIITGKPWMKRPQEPLTTMETGGSLSKGKDGGGNQGANSLTPSFTCHYCKEVGHYKKELPKVKEQT